MTEGNSIIINKIKPGNQKVFMIIFIILLIVCFVIGPLISMFASKDCKEQTDCDKHVDYIYHMGWSLRIPRALGLTWNWLPNTPCITTNNTGEIDPLCTEDPHSYGCPEPAGITTSTENPEVDAEYLTCIKPKENFYIDPRGFSVPLTDCEQLNKYVSKIGVNGKDNECSDCPTISNINPSVNTTCNALTDTPEGEPGPVMVRSGEAKPSGSESYCNNGFKLTRVQGESDKCDICDPISNSITGSTYCVDPIEADLSTANTIYKLSEAEGKGCKIDPIKYTKKTATEGTYDSDECVKCDTVKLEETNISDVIYQVPSGTKPELFATLNELSQSWTGDNEDFYFTVSGSGLPIDMNNKAFNKCTVGTDKRNPCEKLLCSGTDANGNKWVSHYMRQDDTDKTKMVCEVCNMNNIDPNFTSGRSNNEGPNALIVGSEEDCISGNGTVFYDSAFHGTAETCKTQVNNYTSVNDSLDDILDGSNITDSEFSNYCSTGSSFQTVTEGANTLKKCS